MNKQIETEIKKFEELQEKFSHFGADDSEPDGIFQMMVALAITKDPIEHGEAIDWDLYDQPGFEQAAAELTAQTWKIYDSILKWATPADIEELKRYCWRLDPTEFMSWDDL